MKKQQRLSIIEFAKKFSTDTLTNSSIVLIVAISLICATD